MQTSKIEGVKPFNSFAFRSCYYHQLISALSCFDIGAHNVLMNTFVFTRDDFGFEEREILPEKELLRRLGCRIKKCRIGKRRLCKNIAAGNPVIVGVDCYYLESRADTYKQRHDPHYILAYGYNLDTDEAYVIDHDYVTDSHYREKVISLENLLLCHKKFRRIANGKRNTGRIIGKIANVSQDSLFLWQYIPQEQIRQSRSASQNNLAKMRQLFGGDSVALQEKIEKMNDYMLCVMRFYKQLATVRFFQSEEQAEQVDRLQGAYGMIQSLLWKLTARKVYVLPPDQREKVLRKIDEIDALEEKIYSVLMKETV